MGLRIDRHTALWRLVLAFVVLLATTLQVVPRPCAGHGSGATCPASVAAQCSCSCCTTQVTAHRQPQPVVPVFVERMCGAGGKHLLREVPLASLPAAGHVSLPSWRLPGLWVSPGVVLPTGRPPSVVPVRRLGEPAAVALSRLRPPNA